MWESESESIGGQDHGNGGRRRRRLSSTKNTDGFELRDKSWHVVTDVPSDFLVQVGDISFHLHKYPLLSRSGKINKIIQEDLNKAVFHDLPGGATAFETAAKFCYGVPVDLTATNISGLRCAAEYLEMTEDMEQGNLIFKTEAFLSYVVLSSWSDSILVLKSCTSLSPWPEDLHIVRRCTESIAWKVCASPKQAPPDWLFEDVSVLEIDHFVKVVTAINAKSTRIRVMGAVIMHYAAKWLTIEVEDKDQRVIVESLISITPPQKDSVSCSFLLGLLRAARRLEMARGLVAELEKRVGVQLEQATVADLLIPCDDVSETSSCSYDVDLVGRLLEHFLAREATESTSGANRVSPDARARVARLIDGYLTEVSTDGDLSLEKFQLLAEALPESARTCDDGLYRAIDSYLKAHPTLSEQERKRLCRVMDCQKLSVDACLHAAQNERLPLRVVMQVLFSRQVKISNAIANNSEKGTGESQYRPMVSSRKTLLEGTPRSFQEGWAAAKRDINTIEFEIETVKCMHSDLENEMESLQRRFEKMSKEKRAWAWNSGWKKLSYKFSKTTHMEKQDVAAQHTGKAPRSWRNSIS